MIKERISYFFIKMYVVGTHLVEPNEVVLNFKRRF